MIATDEQRKIIREKFKCVDVTPKNHWLYPNTTCDICGCYKEQFGSEDDFLYEWNTLVETTEEDTKYFYPKFNTDKDNLYEELCDNCIIDYGHLTIEEIIIKIKEK
jgi:hypothetical protein